MKDEYPADLASIFKSASSSSGSASEVVDDESEAAVEANRASADSYGVEANRSSADSYGECPLCGDLFPVVSLQVRR